MISEPSETHRIVLSLATETPLLEGEGQRQSFLRWLNQKKMYGQKKFFGSVKMSKSPRKGLLQIGSEAFLVPHRHFEGIFFVTSMMLSMTYAVYITPRSLYHYLQEEKSLLMMVIRSIHLPPFLQEVCWWRSMLLQQIYTPIDDHNNAEIKQFAQLFTLKKATFLW